jgi:ribosomal protein S18 acetylase RimI-like enzyme
MKEITIRNFAPGDARHMAEVQAHCLAACPDTGRFPPGFWLGPGFENGHNIFCAVDDQDELLGYAAISPSYISRHLEARILWLDLRADPQRKESSAIRDVLFDRAFAHARRLARRWPDEKVALSVTYFSDGQASIAYLKDKRFAHYQTCLYLRRDLAEPMPWAESLTVPEGVEVRAWRMETEEEQRAYLAAYDLAFGDEGKNLEGLQHFMKSEYWSVGTTFTAFAGQQIVGSVAIWHHPGSRWAGKTEAVFVVPGWRRRGIARFLLNKAMSSLKERGLAYAELEMDSTNQSALALYQSLGYRIYQEEVSLGRILETQPV